MMQYRFYFSTNMLTGEVQIVDSRFCEPDLAMPVREFWTAPQPLIQEIQA